VISGQWPENQPTGHRPPATDKKEPTMTSAQWNLPAGPQVLGRVISPTGEPLDDNGPLTAASLSSAAAPGLLFETGIKALDVFAPIRHGGTVLLSSPAGVGKLVLMAELIQRLAGRCNGAAVLVGSEDRVLGVNDMMRAMREAGVDRNIAMVFARGDDDEAIRRQAVPTGWALARDLAGSGPVLLFIDRQLAEEQAAGERPASAHPVTVIYLEHVEDDDQPGPGSPAVEHDVRIVLSRELARLKIWPAIDPRQSRSRLLDSAGLDAGHAALVKQAQTIMARPDDPIGRQLLAYGSQPFFTAELYTGQPGEYVPLATALADYAALADGRYADRSVESITFMGSLEAE
jgi:F-type H+-transporting ATPase subunit beta